MNGTNGIRVALATCHDMRNYGSMLQAWATQEFLEGQGFDVRTIDKTGLREAISAGRRGHYARHAADARVYVEKAPFALHGARQRMSRRFGREMGERRAAFEAFARDRFRLTRRAYSFDEARELSAEYDALVVGSDQLWLPVNVAGDYFTLSWAAPGVRKVAYATSFGLSELDGWTSRRAGEFLPCYHAVSVREAQTLISAEVPCDAGGNPRRALRPFGRRCLAENHASRPRAGWPRSGMAAFGHVNALWH